MCIRDRFTTHLNGEDNQISFIPEHEITEDMLQNFDIENGVVTEEGIRTNIKVGILYIQSWLLGQGAAALFNLMEDAATAEISRSQLWQWYHKKTITNESVLVDKSYLQSLISEEVENINEFSRNLVFGVCPIA